MGLAYKAIDGVFMTMAKVIVRASGRNPNKRDYAVGKLDAKKFVISEQWTFKDGTVRYNGHELFLFDRLGKYQTRVEKSEVSRLTGQYLCPEDAARTFCDWYFNDIGAVIQA